MSPRGGSPTAGDASREGGQATVELALVLPVLVALAIALIQAALVARDQVLVVHAARAAAREASVDAPAGDVRAAAERVLPGAVVDIAPKPPVGEPRAVEVRYVCRTDLPLVGALFPDPELRARAVMRAER